MWKLVPVEHDPSRAKIMRRLQLGVFAVAVVGVAAVINGLINGFGLGAGSGGAPGGGESEVLATVEPVATPKIEPRDAAPPEDVVEVLIDERAYFVRSADGWEEVTLQTVLDEAAASDGIDGVKLRVLRTEAARASAEQELLTSATDAGLDRTAVVIVDEFVAAE